jgi:hypothetical protein
MSVLEKDMPDWIWMDIPDIIPRPEFNSAKS